MVMQMPIIILLAELTVINYVNVLIFGNIFEMENKQNNRYEI